MKKLTRRNDITEAQSMGLVLQAFLVSVQREEYQDILEKHAISNFEANTWYPMELILEIFETLQTNTNSIQNLVSIGIKVVDVIDFKSRFPTLMDLLNYLPQLEHELHKNNPGWWQISRPSQNCIEIQDHTVWPHDLEYGVLYGFTNLYQHENNYTLERVRIELDKETGDEVGVYHISW